jgi:hypothetical protein
VKFPSSSYVKMDVVQMYNRKKNPRDINNPTHGMLEFNNIYVNTNLIQGTSVEYKVAFTNYGEQCLKPPTYQKHFITHPSGPQNEPRIMLLLR